MKMFCYISFTIVNYFEILLPFTVPAGHSVLENTMRHRHSLTKRQINHLIIWYVNLVKVIGMILLLVPIDDIVKSF